MSDDDSDEVYVISKNSSDIEKDVDVYAKAPSKEEAKDLFDHANKEEIK